MTTEEEIRRDAEEQILRKIERRLMSRRSMADSHGHRWLSEAIRLLRSNSLTDGRELAE